MKYMRHFSIVCAYVLLLDGVTASAKKKSNAANHVNQISCEYNGQPTMPSEFPFIVNLVSENSPNYFCAGALIGLDVVITAADCIHNKISGFGGNIPVKSLEVHAGDQFIGVPEPDEQVLSAAEIILHPDFKFDTWLNDIALIKLEKAFQLTEYVKPIQLPSKDRAVMGGTGKIAGWNWDGTKILKTVGLSVMAGPLCEPEMTDGSGGQFCAGGRAVDSCQGDKAGPFVCSEADNELCGLVSFSKGCDCRTIIPPGVYVNIYHYKSWIEANHKFGSTGAGSSVISCSLMMFACIVAHLFKQ